MRYYQRAELATDEPVARRSAQLGQLMCCSALELESAHELLHVLEASQQEGSDPLELVRMADKRLGLGFRFGFIKNLQEARAVAELVPQVSDPFARSSFRCALAYALNLSSYYQEAHRHALDALDEAVDLRIDPVLPSAHTMLAISLAGQRRYGDAHEQLDRAAVETRRCVDLFGEQMVYSSRMRLLLQEGRAAAACAVEPPELKDSLPAMRGEVLASRALVLASIGRLPEARSLARTGAAKTRGIEATLLAAAVEAVCRINGREAGVLEAAEALIRLGFETGAVDVVVTAYRANPDLLGMLLSATTCREQTVYLVARAGDHELAGRVAGPSGQTLDPRERLSKREHEVYVLACEGLSNQSIAQRLFIEPTTVKRHLQHVYDKLGVRSRTALALNAARDRYHAAPAIGSVGGETDRDTSSSSDVGSLGSKSSR